jgi:hypothetical protein
MEAIGKISVKKVVYDPIDLVSNERRRIQILLLGEYNLDLKVYFFLLFLE